MTTYPHETASTASPSYQNFSSGRERGMINSRYGANLYFPPLNVYRFIFRTWKMRVEQQPLKSRMSGVGEKSTSPLLELTDFRQSPSYWYQISGFPKLMV